MKTLYIIDGHAQFFRAFHAIRTPMTSPVTKEPTNATFGFTGMLLKLFRACRPDYFAVVIDVSGDRETFRSEIFPEYKANREPAPETLGPQIERCVSMLGAIGAPVVGLPGFEADDVIATIVDRLAGTTVDGEPLLIRIVSKDKDLQQLLIDGRVEMYDVHTDELIDVKRLREDKGIAPEQVIDMLALMGDTVDNVPGVEGVGPKTAAQLIHEWGSLENLLAHAGEVKGKRGEKLREAAERLPLSRRLVTLERRTPIEFDLADADVKRLHLERLGPIFRELGFNRYNEELKELLSGDSSVAPGVDGQATAPERMTKPAAAAPGLFPQGLFDDHAPAHAVNADYTCVRAKQELDTVLKAIERAEIVSLDTETTSLSPRSARLCGVSISVTPGAGWYIPVRSPALETHLDEPTVIAALRPWLENPAKLKCGHNLKYDMLIFRAAGAALRGMSFDSMVASYLVDAGRSSHSLDALSQALLNHVCIPISDLIGAGRSQRRFDAVPLEAAAQYAAEDADIGLRLHGVLAPQVRAMGLQTLFDDVEMPLVEVLAEMEWNGVRVDPAELDRQAERLQGRIAELRRQIIDASPRPFNPDSPKQLAAILFNKPTHAEEPGLGIRPQKRTATGYSTDIEVLENLANDPDIESPVPALIVEYRHLAKLVGTYLVALKEAINPETGRIHTSFHQTVAATGRLASSDPNLQNIPIRTDVGREIRKAFVAPPGRLFITADYSQIELRVLAHLSKDEALVEAFHRGEDIHRAVAAQTFNVKPQDVMSEQRGVAKMINFGIVYGITAFGLARRLKIGEKEAGRIITDYKSRFPRITTFLQECVEQARRHGYVETILKRRRPIGLIDARRPQDRALGERLAINSVVQGSAADLIKIAMVQIHGDIAAARARTPGANASLSEALMLLQIHDELLFEAPVQAAEEARAHVVGRMERAMTLTVPLKVDSAVSATWFEGK